MVLTSTHNLRFEQKYEKYQSFLSENFQFFEVKFYIYLNKHVFLMGICCPQTEVFTPQRDKTCLPLCAPNKVSNQPAHSHSLIRVSVVRMKKRVFWLSKMLPVKIPIRLRESADWSESSLGADFQGYVFGRCGSFDIEDVAALLNVGNHKRTRADSFGYFASCACSRYEF